MAFIPLTKSYGQYKCLGSEFACELGPLFSEEDFKAIYDAFKKKIPKADHYPYGFVIGSYSKSSDDGEPGSSAGRPLASLLEERKINGYLIVARYFGGTKLGIPRLRRSILESAEAAIKEAKLGEEAEAFQYEMELEYSQYETLKHFAPRYGYELKETDFGMKVKTKLLTSVKLTEVFPKIGLDETLLQEEKIIHIIKEVKHDSR